ncbi:MAG: DNA-binding response regulator [Ignavibacteria bacterium]|nr:MAG: DNA-binding response regulator [Ignavibacteria bacterium]
MKKIKVMLVDDHVLVTEGLKLALQTQEDIKVIGTAVNGKDAIEKLEKLKPDVILMDINMPEMNGIEAAEIIKDKWNSIKIIMLTMLDNQKFIIEAMSKGIDGYLYKDTNINELVTAIHSVINGKEYLNKEVTENIISYLTHKNKPVSTNGNLPKITPRELEIIKLISKGMTSKAVAEKLFISELTVIKHRKNIIRKMGVKNFTEVVAVALQNNLI